MHPQSTTPLPICAHCGAPFTPRKPTQRFCSKRCARFEQPPRAHRLTRAPDPAPYTGPKHTSRGKTTQQVTCSCPSCGLPFTEWVSQNAKYCSFECAITGRSRPRAERFWSHVDQNGPVPDHQPELGPCWVWTGAAVATSGYGRFRLDEGKHTLAHRYAYHLVHPEVEMTYQTLVCHHCDNRRCVRPTHLFLGTHADNSADKVRKNRHAWGNKQGSAVLTPPAILEIRRLWNDGRTTTQLAEQFGVSPMTVWKAATGRTWKHLPAETLGKEDPTPSIPSLEGS